MIRRILFIIKKTTMNYFLYNYNKILIDIQLDISMPHLYRTHPREYGKDSRA